MPLLPSTPSLPAIATAVNALDARVAQNTAALEALTKRIAAIETKVAEWDRVATDHWVLREELRNRNTAERLKYLESLILVNTRQRIMNVGAIRAILTFLHPEEEHPEVPPEMTWVHDIVMRWIEIYGGRIEAPSLGDEQLEELPDEV